MSRKRMGSFSAWTPFGMSDKPQGRCHQIGALSAQLTGNLDQAREHLFQGRLGDIGSPFYYAANAADALKNVPEVKRLASKVQHRSRMLYNLMKETTAKLTDKQRNAVREQIDALLEYDRAIARETQQTCGIPAHLATRATKVRPLPPLSKDVKEAFEKARTRERKKRQKEHERFMRKIYKKDDPRRPKRRKRK